VQPQWFTLSKRTTEKKTPEPFDVGNYKELTVDEIPTEWDNIVKMTEGNHQQAATLHSHLQAASNGDTLTRDHLTAVVSLESNHDRLSKAVKRNAPEGTDPEEISKLTRELPDWNRFFRPPPQNLGEALGRAMAEIPRGVYGLK
jgi:hypothetical protein